MINLNNFAHSGDKLEVVHMDSTALVKKTFTGDLARASRNVAKQRNFGELYTGGGKVCAASVISFNASEDQCQLLMPYVDGVSGEMFAVHASRSVAISLSETLSNLLFTELSRSKDEIIKTRVLLEKVDMVIEATKGLPLKQLVVLARDKLESLPESLSFPIGPCHGDLTLSNMILSPAYGITLIDFLDTFLESPLQDIAKLKQDFIYGWSFRNSTAALRLKAEIFCRAAYPNAVTQISSLYRSQISALTLLSLCRIAPYIQDEVAEQWLISNLKRCIDTEVL